MNSSELLTQTSVVTPRCVSGRTYTENDELASRCNPLRFVIVSNDPNPNPKSQIFRTSEQRQNKVIV